MISAICSRRSQGALQTDREQLQLIRFVLFASQSVCYDRIDDWTESKNVVNNAVNGDLCEDDTIAENLLERTFFPVEFHSVSRANHPSPKRFGKHKHVISADPNQ